MRQHPKGSEHRQPDHAVEAIFVDRWSARAMSGEPVSRQELHRLFEAARWAPSAFNEQPWRFAFALRDTPAWPVFLDLLVPGNREWCQHAGALLVVLSSRFHARNGKPNRTHAFDTGSAWENMALQAVRQGLVIHGMAGFDVEKARKDLHAPEEYEVIAMVAIGHPGDPAKLPESLRERETPSGRKKIEEFVSEGEFKA